MHRRPLSVDIAGALLYISGVCVLVISVLYCVGLFFDVERQYYKNFVLDVVEGFLMLGVSVLIIVVTAYIVKGANWARLLYAGLTVVAFVWDIFLMNGSNWLVLSLGLAIRGGIVALLFLPKANLYFQSPAHPQSPQARVQT